MVYLLNKGTGTPQGEIGAIRMRKEGASYSQIRAKIKVSKSSLSLWLRDMPLAEKRLRELRDFNAVRVERFSNTMCRKHEDRWAEVRVQATKTIGTLNKRELLVAGIFLYWGEGEKTSVASTSLSNTDPAMILFFTRWLQTLGVPKNRFRVHMHLYADMNIKTECNIGQKHSAYPSSFTKPYIKTSNRSNLSYLQRFTHSMGNLTYHNRDVSEYVLMALDYIRSECAPKNGI